MRLKRIIEEDFVNYKKPSMFLGTISCGGKCCIESGIPLSVCQNDAMRSADTLGYYDDEWLIQRYLDNNITKAIVFGGLEPFEQTRELIAFIKKLREDFNCNDDVVIYTGYTEEEIYSQILELSQYQNIIVKFGRYIPNEKKRFDDVLGVWLASPNQYGKKIKAYEMNKRRWDERNSQI